MSVSVGFLCGLAISPERKTELGKSWISYCSVCRLSLNPAALVCQHRVALVSDWCPYCRKSDFQNLYRLNIPSPVSGESGEITVLCYTK